MFSPRIRLKSLAQLCHRLATATNAGIHDRKIWGDEANRGSPSERRAAAMVRDQLAVGRSLTDALPATGEFYPPLFRQMAEVGEVSGRLGEIYKRLARHYDRVLASRRAFLSRISWPLMQLGIALFVIGVLIWILGMLPINQTAAGIQVDMLGWGLIGNRGLIIYINVLMLAGILVFLFIVSLQRGAAWTRSMQRMVTTLPVVGGAFKTLALARFTWALQLVFDTPMDISKALVLALNATGNDYFARHSNAVAHDIENGRTVTQALATTGVFPNDLLDSIAVGEEGGRLVETMEREAKEYEERSATAIAILAQAAGYLIWFLVAAFIIVMIFRMFASYVGMLQGLSQP
jgi:type II secretory pathway component PulF